jgi:hypothetical protein
MPERDGISIEYEPGTTVGSFDESEFERFQKWLRTGSHPGLTFDTDYIAHLRKTNGGVPKSPLFVSSSGRERLITRIFHFRNLPDSHPLFANQVEVAYTYAGDSEAFHELLVPFAILFAGDLLCFDFRDVSRTKPQVVIWLHEESETDKPATEYVADSFRDFVKMLYADDKK